MPPISKSRKIGIARIKHARKSRWIQKTNDLPSESTILPLPLTLKERPHIEETHGLNVDVEAVSSLDRNSQYIKNLEKARIALNNKIQEKCDKSRRVIEQFKRMRSLKSSNNLIDNHDTEGDKHISDEKEQNTEASSLDRYSRNMEKLAKARIARNIQNQKKYERKRKAIEHCNRLRSLKSSSNHMNEHVNEDTEHISDEKEQNSPHYPQMTMSGSYTTEDKDSKPIIKIPSTRVKRLSIQEDNYRFYNKDGIEDFILIIKNKNHPGVCRVYEQKTQKFYYCLHCYDICKTKEVTATVDRNSGDEIMVYPPSEELHVYGCKNLDFEEMSKKYGENSAKSSRENSVNSNGNSKKRSLRARSNIPEYFTPTSRSKKRKTASLEPQKEIKRRELFSPSPSTTDLFMKLDPLKKNQYLVSTANDPDGDNSFIFDKIWVSSSPNSISNGKVYILDEEFSKGRSTYHCKNCNNHGKKTMCYLNFSEDFQIEVRVENEHHDLCKPTDFDEKLFLN